MNFGVSIIISLSTSYYSVPLSNSDLVKFNKNIPEELYDASQDSCTKSREAWN